MNFMGSKFAAWLQHEMDQREWNQSELARRAGIDRQIVWSYLNGKRAQPDEMILQKIARALNAPYEVIYRAAGLLPPKPANDEWNEKIIFVTDQLPPEERERVYQFAEMLRSIIEKKSKPGKKKE